MFFANFEMIEIFQIYGQNDRIIYRVDYPNQTIILLRVGDHKMTYGKD